jgi:hypothetical protein
MAKIVRVLLEDQIKECPASAPRDNLSAPDHQPRKQAVPTLGSESVAGGRSIFDPHLEIGMP